MISKDEIRHIADLARIGLDEKELEKFSGDLSVILDWVGELEKADASYAEPTARITGLKNKMRQDRVGEFGNRKGIIALFPEEKDGYDKVKSVL